MMGLAGTVFDYVWLGPLPAWLWALGLGAAAALWELGPVRLRRLARISLPKLALTCTVATLCIWVFLVDAAAGTTSASLVPMVAMTVLGAFAAVTVVVVAQEVGLAFSSVALSLAIILPSVAAILQAMGVVGAWVAPDAISLFFGGKSADYLAEQRLDAIASVGRVRGLQPLVHKFAATIGVLTSGAILAAFSTRLRQRVPFWIGALLWIAAALGSLATFFTFSRGVTLGVALALGVAVVNRMRSGGIRAFAALSTLACILAAGFALVVMSGNREVERVLNPLQESSVNFERVEMYGEALRIGLEHPVVGHGYVYPWGRDVALHSVPMRLWVSYGIPGILLYLVAMFLLLRVIIGTAAHRLHYGAAFALVTALIDASFHTSGLFVYDVAQWFALALVLGTSVERRGTVAGESAR
jgi:hypothetical protein